ncbi:putative DUF1713 domain protein [Rosellinia necatrix]|uniref:Small ribosomal subunit protein mS38 n=1 Tax=Rosellinia necatrix TaxID=77044 RepID=A0A1W2TBQ4_ROSNE|nr:putative DUF1713 domain protein [Rosellinia necatrix]
MLLPSTVRRLATAAPQSPLLASFAPTATRATTVLALHGNPRCSPQRRYSSSKPSSPNDSPKGYSAGQVTTSPAQSTKQSGEKQSGEKRRRKAKESSPQRKLPSVPSTQDVPQEALALATFFSLHRPISVTHSFPKAITDDAFAQIFTPRTKPITHNKVMSTLARAADQLEQSMQGLAITTQHVADASAPHDANGEPMQQISLKHPDGTESSVYVQLDHMSGQFLPFHPPPIPQALSGTEVGASTESGNAETASSEQETAAQQEPQTRIYRAMFTLEETIDENGNTRIVAHTPQLIEDGARDDGTTANPPRSFLERMALREIRREQIRGRPDSMLAISVKRQRKLKMKKKKYKKLMRRTRNERRKLDRI